MGAKKTETVDVGSGDVLVDLGFADASERKLPPGALMTVLSSKL